MSTPPPWRPLILRSFHKQCSEREKSRSQESNGPNAFQLVQLDRSSVGNGTATVTLVTVMLSQDYPHKFYERTD